MVHGVGEVVPDPIWGVRRAYDAGETDEFVKPRVIAGTPRIRPGDGIFCFNYRADRMRQMVRALAVEGFDGFDTGTRPAVDLVTMTQYDETFPFPMAFGPMVLSEIVAQVDRKSTRLNSSHDQISYAVFCLKKKKKREVI